MALSSVAIRRPTFITAVILCMIIVGVIFMKRMSVDMFPDVTFPFISVTTLYPGAGPQETETLISKILEEQMSSISGLKNVTSVSQDGVSMVWGEFTLETDSKYAEQQVKDKVAQVRNTLPTDIKEPVIKRFDPADQPVMVMSLTADMSPTALYDLADTKVKDGLAQIKDVSSIEIIGGTKREIHVDIDREKLKEYETSLSNIANHVAANSQNIPIGKVDQGPRELTFRSIGEYRTVQQIKDVIVSFFGSDVPVNIARLGTVNDSTQEIKTKGYINGKAALVLQVYKQSGSNTVEISDALFKRIDKLNASLKTMNGTPKLAMVRDTARPVRMNIADVVTTIIEGILLAIIVVYLFLGSIRSTFITVIALPNSLIGAFIFMGLAHFSINVISLMALSLAVGLLIDDAIVVRENIFRHLELGEDPITAAKKGTDEVALAVIATTLTVIAVFLPVGFLQGMIGQFFKQFGLTVVFAMTISLFDALTTAPMLSAYLIGTFKSKDKGTATQTSTAPSVWSKIKTALLLPAKSFGKFQDRLDVLYEKVMHFTLKNKMLIILGSVLIFIGSLALVTKIPKTFMPTNEFGEFMVNMEAVPGTSLQQMDVYSLYIDTLLRKEKDIELILVNVGNVNGESNVASLFIKMIPSNQRTRGTSEMKEYVRKIVAPYAEKNNVKIIASDISMAGNDQPFNLLLSGENLEQLDAVAQNLIPLVRTIPGLVDVDSNYKRGKPEFQVKMLPLKMEKLGVQSIMAGTELRNMVEGATPAKFRENGLEYDIRVHLMDNQRDLSKSFDQLYVPNLNNQQVKLKNVATPFLTTGPSKVFRRNRARYIMITGNLGKKGAIGDITTNAKNILKKEKLPAGISYEFIGASEDMVDLFRNMVIAAGLSIIFIYLVLASLYESILVPLTIMLALPLAIVGGLIGLFLAGQSINMFTMIGFIMLLGLVTKNSILLVDFIQKLMRRGMDMNEAIIKAGLTRLRPILMTTCALIAGMLPLALGLTEVGRFRQSMGITIIGGLLSSTILTLVIIPAAFGYMNSLRTLTRRLMGRPPLREIDKTEE
ncbi:MAG: efflux RND transporter permease subunit [Elusimicrobia bacterium]|nr:efflux RND transporter permease subunit [Elusimicrobiota bacterium]